MLSGNDSGLNFRQGSMAAIDASNQFGFVPDDEGRSFADSEITTAPQSYSRPESLSDAIVTSTERATTEVAPVIIFAEERAVLKAYRPPQIERVEYLNQVLGHHRYVSVELDGDAGLRTVHIARPESHPDLVSVHVTSERTMPSGARYTSLDARTFLQVGDGEPLDGPSNDVEQLDAILDDLREFFEERSSRPLMINVSPQGYHERDKRLVMGLTDTGGQDKFIEDTAIVSAQLGFQVINVNRGGPAHPKLGDVREGMHYGADGVDLLFISDGNPDFVRKEDMFDEVWVSESTDHGMESLRSRVIREGPCSDLARSLLTQLQREQPPVALVGHYGDGGETVRHLVALMEASGMAVPRTVHIPHSTGLLKKARLEADGKAVDPDLRIPHREHAERLVYDSVDCLLSTSKDMSASLRDQYGARVDGMILIGVDTDRFHPREPGVARTDARYSHLWEMFSKETGRNISDLQKAQIVLEYSRTAPAKDKATTIRAFAESLRDADRDRVLVLNVADPAEMKEDNQAQAAERRYAQELRDLVKELGIEGNVVMQHSFPNELCAELCQVADVYISSAILEPWGMAVSEAAASRLPIVASNAVAIATELLVGEQGEVVHDDGERQLTKGPGALLFKPGNYKAAALALNRVLNQGGAQEREELAQGAYDCVIPACTWKGILTQIWSEHLGVRFDNGTVIVPGRDSK